MKQSRSWLLAVLSILALVATPTFAIAEEQSAHLSGNVELGATMTDTKDNPVRVNEYAKYRADDGVSFAPSLNLESLSKGFLLDIEAAARGPRDQNYVIETDFNRVFQLDFDYQVFEHWKDHETLESLGATWRGDLAGGQPRVTTDLSAGLIGIDTLQDAQTRYYQELDNNYIITHREWEGETSLTIPELPNVTFHAGVRVATREGLEQATTLSKCTLCHVQANGKDIDERTEDFTFGATGKFGMLTVDYEYLTREFEENGASPQYFYDTRGATRAGIPDQSQLLYSDLQTYSDTPDSEKESHELRARVDLPMNSMVSASYVRADIDSDKTGDSSYTLDTSTLSSDFESFFLKGATRIGDLRLSIKGGTYDIDGPDYYAYFPARDAQPIPNQDFDNPQHFESAESRDVTEFGIDGVYRLARGTILRLGYEYEDVDRDEDELGETETNTFKVALKSRLNKQLSGRISYQYQDIDDPFHGENAAGIAQGGIAGLTGGTNGQGLWWLDTDQFRGVAPNPGNNAVYYWNSVYPNRTLDATNQPDEVHEGKFSSTWTPASNMAMTVFMRGRHETNDDVDYKQDNYVPGASFYYAPNNNLILTMAYTFNKMKTENQMCVGWYHG